MATDLYGCRLMGNGTHLGRVRGLGSLGEGAHHWIVQRFTALANVGLAGWLAVSLFRLELESFIDVRTWVASPMVALALMLLIISVFWHLRLGLQVLIEDYVQNYAARLFALVLLNFYVFAGAAFGLLATARVVFSGGAA